MQLAAAKALVALRAKERAPAIVERLSDDDREVQPAAVRALVALGAIEHAPAIAARLQNFDRVLQHAAVEALLTLRAREQAPAIANLLGDEDHHVRQAALHALIAFEAKEQTPAIATRLGAGEWPIRGAARAEALARLGTEKQAGLALAWARCGLSEAAYSHRAESWAKALVALLARGDQGEELPQIVEALKYPTAALGEATEILMGRLRELYPDVPELKGSLRDAVPWLERQLGPEVVARPPVRPERPAVATTPG